MLAVKAENLGKKYIIGHRGGEYARFNEYLSGLGRTVLRRLKNPFKPYDVSLELEDFWALRGVSFDLNQGDRLGIIGHNGSGKSTLLKLLSRITTPTEGRIAMKGRVASLLEVGTGFHPELTGRENIYLNGSILGMKRAEIRMKFDEIVDFSGVEKFLDTPVKRYSSGMYVRLAFAVAAHLDPEVLIIDEVLAVGDSEFQKKCLGKMKEISNDGGRTILFVSHNLNAVQTLCNHALVLEHGKMLCCGDTREAVNCYVESRHQMNNLPFSERKDQRILGPVRFTQCILSDGEGRTVSNVPLGSRAVFTVKVDCVEEISGEVQIELAIHTTGNTRITTLNLRNLGCRPHFRKGPNTIRFTVPRIFLYPDTYIVNLYSEINGVTSSQINDALVFQTIPGTFQNPEIMSEPYQSLVAADYSAETE